MLMVRGVLKRHVGKNHDEIPTVTPAQISPQVPITPSNNSSLNYAEFMKRTVSAIQQKKVTFEQIEMMVKSLRIEGLNVVHDLQIFPQYISKIDSMIQNFII
jgi:hypothetical protein